MARKTKLVVIPSPTTEGKENRDAGKAFLITEMDSVRGEKWAARALMAIAQSGVDIPDEVMALGMGAIAAMGLRALLTMRFEEAEPLLDEMMECIEFAPDRRKADLTRRLDAEDIEEVSTRLLLRSEVFELHTGFSIAAFLSNLGKAATTPEPSLTPSA